MDGSCTKIYISLYWNVLCVRGNLRIRDCVYIASVSTTPTISNEIAGGRETTLILIQIVLARAIRHCHMSQGQRRRDPCRHYQPLASELTRSLASYGETPKRAFSVDSVFHLATGVAVQPGKVKPPIDYRSL